MDMNWKKFDEFSKLTKKNSADANIERITIFLFSGL